MFSPNNSFVPLQKSTLLIIYKLSYNPYLRQINYGTFMIKSTPKIAIKACETNHVGLPAGFFYYIVYNVIKRILQSLEKRFSLCLITWLSKQCKHILFIALNTRLVEWIYSQKITTHATCKLKEVE